MEFIITIQEPEIQLITVASQGEQGIAGLIWVDAGWASGVDYVVNNALEHNGSSYRVFVAHTSSAATEPGIGVDWETVWNVVALEGVPGTTVHNDTTGKQGGTTDESFHTTEDENDAITNAPTTPSATNPFTTVADLPAIPVSAGELLDIQATINTGGKLSGRSVFDTTFKIPLWAEGPLPSDAWLDQSGSIVYIPSLLGEELIPGTSSVLMRREDFNVSGEDSTHVFSNIPSGTKYTSDTTSPQLNVLTDEILDIGDAYQVIISGLDNKSGSVKTDGFVLTPLINGVFDLTAVGTRFNMTRNTINVETDTGAISIRKKNISTAAAVVKLDPYRVLGKESGAVWAWNTLSGKLAKSLDGIGWTDVMLISPVSWSPIDLVVDEVNGNIYVLTFDFVVLKSSDLTDSATWSDVTPPTADANAAGRPYCLELFAGFLFAGEYSGTPELTGGPTLHKYNLSTTTWSESKSFPNARHIHSLDNDSGATLYLQLGDAGYGDDVALWQLPIADIGTDSWVQVTDSPNDYPVNTVVLSTGEIIGSSDKAGFHIMQVSEPIVVGSATWDTVLAKSTWGSAGETARSINADASDTAAYFTAETTVPGIYISIYPYTESLFVFDATGEPIQVIGRTVLLFGSWFNYNKKITLTP